MATELGKLVRVDPRQVWRHEAHDFTPWLVDNIEMLGEVLGMDLEVVAREHAIGSFSLDILARDLGRNRLVAVENQLEATDHAHLGQLITYAAGVDAGVVIWVSRDFREEHRQALDWLNRGEGAEREYFGVVLELLQIDGSKPAVNLRLVASPHGWAPGPVPGPDGDSPLSSKRAAYKEFFQLLIDELREKHRFTNARAGQPQNWYSFSTGTAGFQYSVSFGQGGKLRAELYIDQGDADLNEAAFDQLLGGREDIEKQFGEPLSWERLDNKRACRVACYTAGSIEDPADALERHRQWSIERLLLLKRTFASRLPGLGPG